MTLMEEYSDNDFEEWIQKKLVLERPGIEVIETIQLQGLEDSDWGYSPRTERKWQI